MAKQKLITKCKCRNTGYNDSRYLCFHLCFPIILRSQSGKKTHELSSHGANWVETALWPLCSACNYSAHYSPCSCGTAFQWDAVSSQYGWRACTAMLPAEPAATLWQARKLKKFRPPAQSYFAQCVRDSKNCWLTSNIIHCITRKGDEQKFIIVKYHCTNWCVIRH